MFPLSEAISVFGKFSFTAAAAAAASPASAAFEVLISADGVVRSAPSSSTGSPSGIPASSAF